MVAKLCVCFFLLTVLMLSLSECSILSPLDIEGAQKLKQNNAVSDVAVGDKFMVVGSTKENDYAGAAYVFEWIENEWVFKTRLTATDGGHHHLFGNAVSVHGDSIAVGAPGKPNSVGANSGAVYVFEHDVVENSWKQVALLTPALTAPESLDHFGSGLEVSDKYLVVATQGSFAYLFVRSRGGSWGRPQRLNTKNSLLVTPLSVAIDGDIVVVGMPQVQMDGLSFVGRVYVFQISSQTDRAFLKQTLTAPHKKENSYFGISVAISNAVIVVGTRGFSAGKGAAYIFEKEGSSSSKWTHTHRLECGRSEHRLSVAIDDDIIVVGSDHLQKGNIDQVGAIYLFERSSENWKQVQEYFSPEVEAKTQFGKHISIHSNRIVTTSSAGAMVYSFAIDQENDDEKANMAVQIFIPVAIVLVIILVSIRCWCSCQRAKRNTENTAAAEPTTPHFDSTPEYRYANATAPEFPFHPAGYVQGNYGYSNEYAMNNGNANGISYGTAGYQMTAAVDSQVNGDIPLAVEVPSKAGSQV